MHRRPVVVLLTALVACGGGGGKSASKPDRTTSTTVPARDVASGPFTGKGSARFCDAARSYFRDLQSAQGPTATNDPKLLKAQVAGLRAEGVLMERSAPGEIKPDVTVVFQAFDRYIALLKKYDYRRESIPDAELQKINGEGMQAASQRLDQYGTLVCKLSNSG